MRKIKQESLKETDKDESITSRATRHEVLNKSEEKGLSWREVNKKKSESKC